MSEVAGQRAELEAGARRYVEQTLVLLEGELRELALRALADWERLDIHLVEQKGVQQLWQAIGSLQRPAWGSWNGVLEALRIARRSASQNPRPEEQERLQKAVTLDLVLRFLDRDLPAEVAGALALLGRVPNISLPHKPKKVADVFTLPINLRNLIAHFAPEPTWWTAAAESLRPIVDYRFSETWDPLPRPESYPAPWFLDEDGIVWSFNGLHGHAVAYASSAGEPRFVEKLRRSVLLSFQRILGVSNEQEIGFKRLLEHLAPEDLKGVLLGDFLIGPPTGVGGHSTVHKGIQLSTGRKVAIKILKEDMGDEIQERFQQEATLLSHLSHPNVVSVIGFGRGAWLEPRDQAIALALKKEPWYATLSQSSAPRCYIALEWIDGWTLEEVFLGKAEVTPDTRELADWFLQAASALRAVHDAGLVHRDIKPSNLMVTPHHTIKVMDFGIARRLDPERERQTQPGAVLGTPAYMSPEQLTARDSDEVGPATDVYSLCATFYELFTRTRLFRHDSETAQSVLTHKVTGLKPDRPRQCIRELPWEIETILMGGLEKEITDRYASMSDLEGDLQRFLHDEPIRYATPSPWRRLKLWCRRSPWVASLSATVAILLILVAVGSVVAALVIAESRDSEKDAKDKALQLANVEKGLRLDVQDALGREKWEKARAENAAYVSGLRLAQSCYAANRMHDARQALSETNLELRCWEWHFLRRRFWPELLTLRGHRAEINQVAFSQDGLRLASVANVSGKSSVKVWDAETGKELFPLLGHAGLVSSVAYAPDGMRLATGSHDRTVRLWSILKRGEDPLVLQGHRAGVTSVAWSRDGRLVSSSSLDGTVKLWNSSTGKEMPAPAGHEMGATCVSFSPDSKILASAGEDAMVKLWDVERGQTLKLIKGEDGRVQWVTFSPNGKWLAFTSGRNVILCETREWRMVRKIREAGSRIAFSPDSQRLVSAGWDGMVKLWNVTDGHLLFNLRGHTRAVTTVDHSIKGRIAAGSEDWTVRVWNAPTEREGPLQSEDKLIAFSSDGKLVATARPRGIIVVSDARTGHELYSYTTRGNGEVHLLLFDPKCRFLAFWAERRNTITMLDAGSGKEQQLLEGRDSPLTSFAFSPDGELVAGSAEDGNVALWAVRGGKPLRVLEGKKGSVHQVAFSPDGLRLAAALGPYLFHPGEVCLWEVKTGNKVLVLERFRFAPLGVAFSGDGRWLAASGRTLDQQANEVGEIHLWEAATGRPVHILKGHPRPVLGLTFTPDSRRLASVGEELKLWELASGQELLELPTSGRIVQCTPEGNRLVVTSERGLFVLDGTPQREMLVLEELARGIAFHPRESLIATAGYDLTVKIWDPRTGKKHILGKHEMLVRSVVFNATGTLLASGGEDNEIKIWDVETGGMGLTLTGHKRRVMGVAFSLDGRYLASASADMTVKIWDVSTGKNLRTLAGHTATVYSVAFSPDGQLASGGDEIKLWNPVTGEELFTLPESPQSTSRLAFSPDGLRLVAAGSRRRPAGDGQDGEMIAWNLRERRPVLRFQVKSDRISDVAYSPDGRQVVSGDYDGRVKVWDANSGAELLSCEGHTELVEGVAFGHDGQLVASVGADNTLRFWHVNNPK